MYYNVDNLNWTLLRLQDLSTDPAMKALFERAQVSLNVLAIQIGEPALDRELDKHQEVKALRDCDDADEPVNMRLERMTDLGLKVVSGNPNFNGTGMFIHPDWPHEPGCHHSIYCSYTNQKGWYYDCTIYHDTMWYDEDKDLYTLLERARKYLVSIGRLK
jgi:hypothetical protein